MRTFAVILFLAIAALPFAGMLSTRRPPEPERNRNAEVLAILSPHRREVRQEYSRGFAEWMRTQHGRQVDILWLDVGGTSKILKDLESRFSTSPDAPGVDLLFGGGIAPYLTAIQQSWIAQVPLDPGILADIPALCAGAPVYDSEHRWYGVALSSFGILYNRPLVRRLNLIPPSDWSDLARPEYYSWVGSGDPRSSGSVHMCYEIILQAYGFEAGWSLITRICANVRGFGEAGGTVPREVAAGDIAAGMVIDQYAQTVIRNVGEDALELVLPRRHTMIGPDAIAMIRGTRRPDLCREFIQYALSPEGQRLLYQPVGVNGQQHELYRMPVLKSSYDDQHAPRPNPYDFPAGFEYDNDKGSRRWNILNDLMGVWLLDAHADLRHAWEQTIRMGCPPEQVQTLCAPPVSEEEMNQLIPRWTEARFRQDVMRQWSQAARKRYRTIEVTR